MNTEPLDRLAALAGIEDGWWDFFGAYRAVSPDTKRTFLAAMGFAVGSDAETAQSLAAFEAESWHRPLPPVQVTIDAEGPPVVAVTVAEGDEDAPMRWNVTEEEGACHDGEWRPRDLPVIGERSVEGRLYRRHAFALPGTPWPGLHQFRLSGPAGEAAMRLIVAPAKAYRPASVQGGGRLWGVATQIYSLRSKNDWGVGDFGDLTRMARRLTGLGAAAVGINPLHALFANRPERFSPYSPSSRLFLNTMYIDIETIPDFAASAEARRLFASAAFQERLLAARASQEVDYRLVGALKLAVLKECWRHFEAHHLYPSPSSRGEDFRAFQQTSGHKAERFAIFEALQEFFLQGGNEAQAYWRHWPAEFHDPEGPAVGAFAAANRSRVEFFWYLQWLADQQVRAAQASCADAGMAVGLYRDLGVGIADDGAEAWGNQRLLCLGVSVGAPPDPLNLAGQDWGLVPFNPIALRDAAYRPFFEVLEANMRHAGAMRLDHAMSLERLYWVPRGAKADHGAYVRMPMADMFGLVTLASRRHRCLVIGEDLGTVPRGFRQRMRECDILGYRLLVFEKADDRLKAPAEIDPDTLVAFGTHDLPSLAGWWRGIDLEERHRLGLYPDPAMGTHEAKERDADRRRLVATLAGEGLLDPEFPVAANLAAADLDRLILAIHAYLGRVPAALLMVQFEDLLGLALQMNLPGTTDQHPNWRIRYPMDMDAMLGDPRLVAVAHDLSGRGLSA